MERNCYQLRAPFIRIKKTDWNAADNISNNYDLHQ